MGGTAGDGRPQADARTPGGGRARPRGRLGWLLLAVLAAAGYAVVASRGPQPAAHPPTGDVAKAAEAIDALLDPASGRDPIALLPADFTEVTGVVPARVTGPDGTTRAIHVGGDCSAPWGDDPTRWDYSVGCQAHDLGYDLLRYAAAKGEPLDAERRRALDDRLSADMRAQCDLNPRGSPGLCRMVAGLFSAGLVANSWHQRWGPPATEPIATWAVVLVVVVVLLVVRLPVSARRRPHAHLPPPPPPSPEEADRARYLGLLRVAGLTGVVAAETALAFAPVLSVSPSALWPLTWLLQLAPLFFFACGHGDLLAWRAAREAGQGYGDYLAGRLCWLIRPVLAFVTAWLVVPLSLDLLAAPDAVVEAFGRLVLQPLWLLGLTLVVVGAAPALDWLHRRTGPAAPAAGAALVAGLGLFGRGTVAAYAGGIALALLFALLAHGHADGWTRRAPRPLLVVTAVAALVGLGLWSAFGDHGPMLLAAPAGTPSFVPTALGVLLLGIAQVCLAALPGERGVRAVAGSRAARAVRLVRSAPMTVYLGYLCAALALAGLVGAARSAGVSTPGDWLARPSTLLALALLGVPAALGFVLFEWRSAPPEPPAARRGSRWDGVAAAMGAGYAAAGVLGFAAVGLTGSGHGAALLGVPIDPMAGIVHLLLGWHLLHAVRVGTSSTPGPWLLAAPACVPPMIIAPSGAGLALHGATMVVALVAAAACARPRAWRARAAVERAGG